MEPEPEIFKQKEVIIFDDLLKEIQELIALIKNDITTLNVVVSDLQTLQNTEIDEDDYSKDTIFHSTTVCDDLKNKLIGATKKFQDLLTRTEVVSCLYSLFSFPFNGYKLQLISILFFQ